MAKDESKRLLIVEDEPAIRHLLKETFKGKAWCVVSVGNGEDALKAIQREQPIVVLLDLVMPKLSGWELCAQLKGNEATSYIKVIVVSALALWWEPERALSLGADAYVTKPFHPMDIVDMVERLTSVAT